MKLTAALLLAATVIASPVQSPLHAAPHRETRDEAGEIHDLPPNTTDIAVLTQYSVLSTAHLAKQVTTGTMASVFPESAGTNAGALQALVAIFRY
jgi:hypothetical protein